MDKDKLWTSSVNPITVMFKAAVLHLIPPPCKIRKKNSDSSRESSTNTITSNESEVSTTENRTIGAYQTSKMSDEVVSVTFWNRLLENPTRILELTPKQITGLLNHSDENKRIEFSYRCRLLNKIIPEQLERLFRENKALFDAIFCETLLLNIGLQRLNLENLPEIFKLHNPWIYNKIIKENPVQYPNIPEPFRDEEVFFQSLLDHKNYYLVKYIKSPERAMKLMTFQGAEIYFFFISKDIRRNQQWLKQAIASNPLIGACKILDDHKKY